MNCERCQHPSMLGRKALKPRRPKMVRLEHLGAVLNCDKYRCPECRAVFFFPKLELLPA